MPGHGCTDSDGSAAILTHLKRLQGGDQFAFQFGYPDQLKRSHLFQGHLCDMIEIDPCCNDLGGPSADQRTQMYHISRGSFERHHLAPILDYSHLSWIHFWWAVSDPLYTTLWRTGLYKKTCFELQNMSIAQQLFNALSLTETWTSLDVIDGGCSFILANESLLRENLNKRIVGDLSLLRSDVPMIRRKSLLAFARRVAASEQAAIIRKRKQIRTGKKTVSRYSYKLITA